MATHAAPPTLSDRCSDGLVWLGAHMPSIIRMSAAVVGVVVAAVIVSSAGSHGLAVLMLFGGVPGVVFPVCWQAMRAPWDKLTDSDEAS